MLTKLLADLRFVIGLFFLIIGCILAVTGLVTEGEAGGQEFNLWTGLVMLVFAISMIAASYLGRNKKEA